VGVFRTSRTPPRYTDPRELQEKGENERGTKTNQLDTHPEVGDVLRAYLRQWEDVHPEAKPTQRVGPLPALETEQLRALGYID